MYRLPLEIAILQMSNKEHDELHADPKNWVNDHKVFPKPVRSVDVPDHPSKPSASAWVVTIVHFPHCAAMGSCDPV